MSEPGAARFDETWLALREGADARARSGELAGRVAALLREPPATADRPVSDRPVSDRPVGDRPVGDRPPAAARYVVHDLGCGTGSMGRWLAPRLPGPQHWVLHDRDPDLLARAAAGLPGAAADGTAVTARPRPGDVTALTADDLAGASLVTASALLDLLTLEEVHGLAATCVGAGCPALFVLSVAGRVDLDPADPLDAAVAAAFDAHQRRVTAGRRLLGPDAPDATARAFTALGARVQVRDSPWRLGPDDAALTAAWLRGWVAAAAEQDPDLPLRDYADRRLAAATAGALAVTVHHVDLLALPAEPPAQPSTEIPIGTPTG